MNMLSVTFGCPQCGRGVETAPGSTVVCGHCGATAELPPHDGKLIEQCLACGCEELYRHRDFNQKLGIVLLALGIFLWWLLGSFWPMVAAAGIDLLLFLTLPDVAICYDCKAHHRDFSNIATLPKFDLERHEHYRRVKARAKGRLPSAEE